jgi:aspartate/tyrosine/aromatic aminotransferase
MIVTDQQVEYLIRKKHIYIPRTSRINFTCINTHNVDYITQSINEAVLFTSGAERGFPKADKP